MPKLKDKHMTKEDSARIWASKPKSEWEYVEGTLILDLAIPVKPDMTKEDTINDWNARVVSNIKTMFKNYDSRKQSKEFTALMTLLSVFIKDAAIELHKSDRMN